mmetsp:Transcript_27475/g.63759  ORF Transcript_27475/g.63759 Transcript_27475/m.63759 type:complete len:144 (+) Transcript_27475:729-1160(+)
MSLRNHVELPKLRIRYEGKRREKHDAKIWISFVCVCFSSSFCSLLFPLSNRIEQGDLRPRVRNLETERATDRQNLVLKNIASAVYATILSQIGLSLGGTQSAVATVLRRIFLTGAFLVGLRVPYGMFQLRSLDKYNERFGLGK